MDKSQPAVNDSNEELENRILNQFTSRFGNIEKPEQILTLVENEKLRDFVSLLAIPERGQTESKPQWVSRATKEFWRCFEFFPRGKTLSQNYQLGFMMGFAKEIPPEVLGNEKRMIDFCQAFTAGELRWLIFTAIDREPAADAAEFYLGISEGLKRSQDFNPSGPWMVYLIIALAWQEIATFKNTTQLHNWLENIIGRNLTGNRDRIAKLCQKIGIRFSDKGGRPTRKPRKG